MDRCESKNEAGAQCQNRQRHRGRHRYPGAAKAALVSSTELGVVEGVALKPGAEERRGKAWQQAILKPDVDEELEAMMMIIRKLGALTARGRARVTRQVAAYFADLEDAPVGPNGSRYDVGEEEAEEAGA